MLLAVPLALAVLAAVVTVPTAAPRPAAAQASALPPPCTSITFVSAVSCNNPPLGTDPGFVFLDPLPTGMVDLETEWFYFGIVLPPDTNGDGVPDPVTDTFYYCLFPQGDISPVQTPFCPTPVPVIYYPIALPTGLEVDFGSPDETGTSQQDAGWWPAGLVHTYEEKGVHPIEQRIYWKAWAFGFYDLLGVPGFFIIRGTEVAAITERTIEYQVDESRGTLDS